MFYIYSILNTLNYKIYVGQTQNMSNRWSAHKCEANADRLQYPLYRALRKYGFEIFQISILEVVNTAIEADLSEQVWIQTLDSRNIDMGYNLAPGGSVPRGWHHSEESKKKISEAQLSEKNHRFGKTNSEEWIEVMSNLMTGRPLTEEWKQKIGNSNRGKIISPESRRKMSVARTGKSFSEDHKRNISESLKGKIVSEETRRKMSSSFRKFSMEQELEILRENKLGLSCQKLGLKYGCSASTVWNILQRNKNEMSLL